MLDFMENKCTEVILLTIVVLFFHCICRPAVQPHSCSTSSFLFLLSASECSSVIHRKTKQHRGNTNWDIWEIWRGDVFLLAAVCAHFAYRKHNGRFVFCFSNMHFFVLLCWFFFYCVKSVLWGICEWVCEPRGRTIWGSSNLFCYKLSTRLDNQCVSSSFHV